MKHHLIPRMATLKSATQKESTFMAQKRDTVVVLDTSYEETLLEFAVKKAFGLEVNLHVKVSALLMIASDRDY